MNNNKPNVIFIYPDQMRFDAMSNTGNKTCKTPAFDRLAKEGMNFLNAYTSFPLCCPFRASVLTGKYAHANGMYANHYPIDLNQEFLPEIMKENGYATGWIGKWHLSGGSKGEFVPKEYRCGFDTFIGYSRGHQYFNGLFYRDDDKTPRKSTRYEPEYQTDHLFEFIDKSQKEDKPFFAGICYGLPHPPLDAPEWYLNLYNSSEVDVLDSVPEEEREKAKEFLAKYYGLVACVDNQLLRILNYLDNKGLSNNTMIVMCSDHGEMAGEHSRYAKRSYYDSSMHVPFIIKYPNGVEADSKCDDLVDPSVDIFPTILNMCGIETPSYVQGHSLKPLLTNNKEEFNREHVYYQIVKQPIVELGDVVEAERGIRTKEFVYVEKEGKPFHLIDLRTDKLEMENLINSPEYKDVNEKFHNILMSEMELYKDDWAIAFDEMPHNHHNHKEASAFAKSLFNKAVLEN